MSISYAYLNGEPATVEQLAPLAFAGYAHFTAMQVRNFAVRGLDLHLNRLRQASHELFDDHLPDEQVVEFMSLALKDAPQDVSLTCFISARPGEFMQTRPNAELNVLIKVTDPVTPPTTPVTLEAVRHERHLPRVKHVGEVAKTRFLRQAHKKGFDDAVFLDSSGRLSEATIWNLAFWDGDAVNWPEAEVLPGVTMQILARRLAAAGIQQTTRAIKQEDLQRGDLAAVVMNSWSPAISIGQISGKQMADARDFVQLLHQAYDTEPLHTVRAEIARVTG